MILRLRLPAGSASLRGMSLLRAGQLLGLLGLIAMGASLGAQTVGKPLPEDAGAYRQVLSASSLPSGVRPILSLKDNCFSLYFVDAENKVIAPPVHPVVVRGFYLNMRNRNFHIALEPASDGPYLTSPRVVVPPHNLRLQLVLPVPGQTGDAAYEVLNEFGFSAE